MIAMDIVKPSSSKNTVDVAPVDLGSLPATGLRPRSCLAKRIQALVGGDEVEGERIIPLTPCVAHLLAWLSHRERNP